MTSPRDDGPEQTTVTVLAFGAVADVVGAPRLDLVLSEESCVSDVLQRVLDQYPGLASRRTVLRVAVNGVYAAEADRVLPGDELALIPPVAGG